LDIHVYWNILTMHGPINVKSPNNTSKWQMGFNSAFKGLIPEESFMCYSERRATRARFYLCTSTFLTNYDYINSPFKSVI
jgi:hypothetical protein